MKVRRNHAVGQGQRGNSTHPGSPVPADTGAITIKAKYTQYRLQTVAYQCCRIHNPSGLSNPFPEALELKIQIGVGEDIREIAHIFCLLAFEASPCFS